MMSPEAWQNEARFGTHSHGKLSENSFTRKTPKKSSMSKGFVYGWEGVSKLWSKTAASRVTEFLYDCRCCNDVHRGNDAWQPLTNSTSTLCTLRILKTRNPDLKNDF